MHGPVNVKYIFIIYEICFFGPHLLAIGLSVYYKPRSTCVSSFRAVRLFLTSHSGVTIPNLLSVACIWLYSFERQRSSLHFNTIGLVTYKSHFIFPFSKHFHCALSPPQDSAKTRTKSHAFGKQVQGCEPIQVIAKLKYQYEIWCMMLYSDGILDCVLPDDDTLQSCRWFPAFQRKLQLPASRWELICLWRQLSQNRT